jgi:membrane-bound lytic murein transglycosylase B
MSDTTDVALDGDPQWAHALGPMQFLPNTWRLWGLRANNDGHAPDPQNIADAALAAGSYLCASGGDLSVPSNWWRAVFVYNNSVSYGRQVYSAADAYAVATH